MNDQKKQHRINPALVGGILALPLLGLNTMQSFRAKALASRMRNLGVAAEQNYGAYMGDPRRMLEAFDSYADLSKGMVKSRMMGIPFNEIAERFPPSGVAKLHAEGNLGKFFLQHNELTSPQVSEFNNAKAHYRGFSENPRQTTLKEILYGAPLNQNPTKSTQEVIHKKDLAKMMTAPEQTSLVTAMKPYLEKYDQGVASGKFHDASGREITKDKYLEPIRHRFWSIFHNPQRPGMSATQLYPRLTDHLADLNTYAPLAATGAGLGALHLHHKHNERKREQQPV